MPNCECTWKNCHHKDREVRAADLGNVTASPALCMWCLFVCCGEREDEEDSQTVTDAERFAEQGLSGYGLME